jgi:predicted DNA-binding transcriptional regulator AlpA
MSTSEMLIAPQQSLASRILDTHDTLNRRLLAAVLLTGVSTLDKMMAARKVPKPFKVGKMLRWRSDEIRAWLIENCPDQDGWEKIKAVKAAQRI